MNVLQIITVLSPTGVPRVCIEQTRALRMLNHDARILSVIPNPQGPCPKDFTKGIDSHVYYEGSLSKTPFPFFNLASNFLVSRYVPFKLPKDFNPDIILCHNFADAYKWLRLAKVYGAKFVLFLHDVGQVTGGVFPYMGLPDYLPFMASYGMSFVKKKAFRSVSFRLPFHVDQLDKKILGLEKDIVRKVDGFIAHSNLVARAAEEAYGIRPAVLHPGTNPLPRIPKRRGDFVLTGGTKLSAGFEYKPIFDACAKVDAKLVLVGRVYDSADVVLKEVRESGLSDYEVHVTTPTSKSEKTLSELYKSCRCYAFWVKTQFGLPATEAAASGSPIIQNRESGSSELFKHGVDGYFPERQDVNLYAEYIADLMADERKAYRMGRHAWMTCKTWTWTDHAKRLIDIFENVA